MCREIFLERGPPNEILTDNGRAFTSELFKQFCQAWGVSIIYRCAHRPSTNGIVERCHRTVKRIASRSNIPIKEAVFWYNISSDFTQSPMDGIYQYKCRLPREKVEVTEEKDDINEKQKYSIGEKVYYKLNQHMRCSEPWSVGEITRVHGKEKFDVDGVPRSQQDIRKLYEDKQLKNDPYDCETSSEDSDDDCNSGNDGDTCQRRTRERKKPEWHTDYIFN